MIRVFRCVTIILTVLGAGPVLGAEIRPNVSPQDAPRLLSATAFVRGLDEDALVKLVPEQSGLHFVGCPNCTGGRQENQLTWTPERPDEVTCRYCKHRLPQRKISHYARRDRAEPKG